MGKLEFIYRRINHNILLDLLKNKDINQSLAYMVDFKEHKKLTVIPRNYSIEVANDKITMVIILLVGFELEEYEAIKSRPNLHIIAFDTVCKKLIEFKKIKNDIKEIDFISLFFMTLARTKSKKLHDLIHLRTLSMS
jgi:hypothetical protein